MERVGETGVPVALESGPRAIRTRGMVKRYGRETALAELDMEVPEGSVYVLVGPNGAGKTTTLRILLDLLRPDEGEAEVLGMETREYPAEIRAHVGYIPERHDFHYGWLRVDRLVEFHAGYHRTWDEEYARELTRRLEIPTDKKFAHLSKGQARRVQLLLALAHRPSLLLLDEPTDGLDPVGKNQVLGLIADHLASTPTTVLVSTHLIYELEGLGDHLAVMREGRLTAQISRDHLREGLRRYLLAAPPGWDAGALEVPVVGVERAGGEVSAVLWGEEKDVRRRLEATGASVREASPLSLQEAALALLSRDQEPGKEVAP